MTLKEELDACRAQFLRTADVSALRGLAAKPAG